MDETKRVRVIISGRVQGVYYRANTRFVAEELGLSGWVRNLADGRVEAVFEGDEDKLDKMLSWCRRGPNNASVTKVDVSEEKPEGSCEGFKIKY